MALTETELMNQYHNRHLTAFIIVLNSLKANESISCYGMIDRIKKIVTEDSPYSDEMINSLIEEACKNNILVEERKKYFRKIPEESILLPMTLQEKIYLKNILKSPYALLFLDLPVIQEILQKLSDVPEMDFSRMIDFTGVSKELEFDEAYIKNFRLLMQAVQEHRKINFVNINAQGNEILNKEKIPFKIEYSVIMRCFWLSLWNQWEKRPFKANISRLSDIQLLDRISDEEYQTVMNMMEQKKEKHPIVMIITDRNSAIERINLMFSMYHKKTERIADDKIKISLSYYNFDENEIIDGIMSFGTAVQVLAPERVVEKIKEKLTAEIIVQ